MPPLRFTGLTAAVTIALGGLMPAIFLPQGLPAAWLLAAMVVAFVAARRQPAPLDGKPFADKALRGVAACFAVYLMSFVLTTLYHGGLPRELDKAIRYGLGLFLILWLARARLDPTLVKALIVFAAATACGYAAWDRLVNGAARVGSFMNAIQFGVLAAQVASLNAVLALQAWRDNAKVWQLYAVASVAALSATLMTGSLTAVMTLGALPVAILVTGWLRPSGRAMLATLLVGAVAAAVLVQTQTSVALRAVAAVQEVADYESFRTGKIAASSNGARIENFQNAWNLFLTAPVMGVGSVGYLKIRREQVQRGELTAYSGSMGVAHNEYLDALAKRGIVGLAGLLALLLGTLVVFCAAFTRVGARGKPWAVAGVMVCSGFALAALTQNVLTHSSGANFFIVAVLLLLRLALQESRVSAAASSEP